MTQSIMESSSDLNLLLFLGLLQAEIEKYLHYNIFVEPCVVCSCLVFAESCSTTSTYVTFYDISIYSILVTLLPDQINAVFIIIITNFSRSLIKFKLFVSVMTCKHNVS